MKIIPEASDDDLQKLLAATQKEMDVRQKRNLVEYIPDFCSGDLVAAVMAECMTLDLPDALRKASSQWLSCTDEPYVYADANPVHHAKNIKEFPAICQVLDNINADSRFNGLLDSCLILKYACDATSVSLHADDEDCFDQTKSICNFSIGVTRTLEFVSKSGNKPVTAVNMENGSITHMKPGTQQALKHMVRGSSSRAPNLRFSLSFRSLAKHSPVGVNANPGEEGKSAVPIIKLVEDTSAPAPLQKASSPPRRVCLVAGDSYAARLDTVKLGRNVVCVDNVAKGGAKMHQVIKQLEDYAKDHTDHVIVEKVLVSVGTNDIRNCHNGVEHLKGKFKALCGKIAELYPNSRVYFQSLIPLPCLSQFDWISNSNVLEFNKLLFYECTYRKFNILSAFSCFSVPWDGATPNIRNNRLFIGNDIHPSTKRGMGVLAKLYIRAIHSKYFDPFILQ